jgi:hypothetical protein
MPFPPPDNVFTYRRLRRIIGLLGISLPTMCVLLLFTPGQYPAFY